MVVAHGLCQGDTTFSYPEDEDKSLVFDRETGIVHILHEDSHGPHLNYGDEEHDDNRFCGNLAKDAFREHMKKNAVQDETDNQGTGYAEQVNEGREAHDAGIGMEDPHADYEEWQGADEGKEVAPEMGCQHLASFCNIGCNHSCDYDSNAIECEDAPIWQGCLRKIPIYQFISKEGFFEFVKYP